MPDSKDYAKRFVSGSATVFMALIVAGLTGIILRMFLMRSFAPEDYGLFFLVFTLVSFLILFRDLGLNLTLAKHIPEFMIKRQFGKIKSSIAIVVLLQLLMTVPISLALIIFSDQIAMAICGTLAASIVVKILAIWFLATLFYHVFRYTLQGLQNMRMYAAMEVAYIVSIFLLVIFLVRFFSPAVESVAFGYLIGAVGVVTLLLVVLYRKYPEIFNKKVWIEKGLVKKTLLFALPVFLYGIGGLVLAYTDTLMVGIFHNTTQVGYYQAALPLLTLLSYFSLALTIVLFPMISELWARGKKKLLGQAVHFLVKFSFMFIIPAALVFVVFPSTVLLAFSGRVDYLAAILALQIMAGTAIVAALGSILQCTIAGIGKPIIVAKIVGVMACLNFITNLFLIPTYGIAGAAAATLVSSLTGVFLAVYFSRKFIKFTFPATSLLKTLIAGLGMLVIILILKSLIVLPPWWLEFIPVVVLSLFFYVVFILGMRAIDMRDLKLLNRVLPIPKRLFKIAKKFVK